MASLFFPDFFDSPLRMRFTQQEDDEIISLLLRQHWVTNVFWILIVLLSLFLPTAVRFIDTILDLGVVDRFPQLFLGLYIVFYLVVAGYAIESFLYWYFNVYIVTNKHLVDIRFNSLLSHDLVENQLDDVQSVRASVNGVLASFFHYGDVVIETAAGKDEIVFAKVSQPEVVADRIQDLQEAYEEGVLKK